MSLDLLEYFERERAEWGDGYMGMSVYCEVAYPDEKNISYKIHSWGGDRKMGPAEDLNWKRTEGVDAFFGFEMYGIVEYPDELKHCNCKFMLNGLSSTDRFFLNAEGLVGDGWFIRDTFLFRLSLSLDASRGLFQQMKRMKDNGQDRFRIRFDLIRLVGRKVKLTQRSVNEEVQVGYSICRVYC
jgi:hypothetical protein